MDTKTAASPTWPWLILPTLVLLGISLVLMATTRTNVRLPKNGRHADISPLTRDIFKFVTIDFCKNVAMTFVVGTSVSVIHVTVHAASVVGSLFLYYKLIEPHVQRLPDL